MTVGEDIQVHKRRATYVMLVGGLLTAAVSDAIGLRWWQWLLVSSMAIATTSIADSVERGAR